MLGAQDLGAATVVALVAHRVLVIDDSPAARSFMRGLLVDAGFEVQTRASAIGASSQILKDRIDTVVVDMHMPALSGDRFVRLLRSKPCFRNLCIVLVSGDDDALSSMQPGLGADLVVRKDRLADQLIGAIQRSRRRVV